MEDGGRRDWDAWLERRERVREKVAEFIGAEADEIAFVPNTSTGMNLIVDLLGDDGPVLSDELEFPTVTLPWIHRGIPVHFLPAVEGILRLESFAAARPRGRPPSASATCSSRTAAARTSTPSAQAQGRPPPRGLRQPVPRGFSRGREAERDRRPRHGRAQVAVRRLRRRLLLREPGDPRGAPAAGHRLAERRAALRLRQPAHRAQDRPSTGAPSWAARPSPRSSRWARPSTTSRRSASTPSPSACWPSTCT